jgi:hypothetical protein
LVMLCMAYYYDGVIARINLVFPLEVLYNDQCFLSH